MSDNSMASSACPDTCTTQVYFIRHGIAAERSTYADDAQRPLVEKGMRTTRTVAKRLADLGLPFDTLLTSPFFALYKQLKFYAVCG